MVCAFNDIIDDKKNEPKTALEISDIGRVSMMALPLEDKTVAPCRQVWATHYAIFDTNIDKKNWTTGKYNSGKDWGRAVSPSPNRFTLLERPVAYSAHL